LSRGRQISRLKSIELSEKARETFLHEWDAKSLRLALSDFPAISSLGLFGNNAPLEVEIGPGTGEYLCALAVRNKERNFLGIEASKRAAYYVVNRASKMELTNLRVIRANAKLLYPLITAEAWSRVYLHFPDPVHKRKDEKHRIFDRLFLDVMESALPPGGEISVVSDEKNFFGEMLKLAKSESRYEFAHESDYLEGFEPESKSRFQRFWEKKGITPRRFILRKK
jgi:tRNA (guanine-N7-)-methyltransferase